MIRVAATGDVHFGNDSAGTLRESLSSVAERADLLLLAGDLTKSGDPQEARVLAAELTGLSLPVVAVLGNHDYHSDREREVRAVLEGEAGVSVLDGEFATVHAGDATVGVAGTKGFGGGFEGTSGTEFGEPEMKAFIRHTRSISERLEASLAALDADLRIALLHYSPIRETLLGEPPEIFPFLGSYLLAEAVDDVGADLVLHGHAHRGTEKGVTPGGVEVRNVALPVIKQAYAVYCFDRVPGNGSRPSVQADGRDAVAVGRAPGTAVSGSVLVSSPRQVGT